MAYGHTGNANADHCVFKAFKAGFLADNFNLCNLLSVCLCRHICRNLGHFFNLNRLGNGRVSRDGNSFLAFVYILGKHCDSAVSALQAMLLNIQSFHFLFTGNAQTEYLLYYKE